MSGERVLIVERLDQMRPGDMLLPHHGPAIFRCPRCGSYISLKHHAISVEDGMPSVGSPIRCQHEPCGWAATITKGVIHEIALCHT